MPRNSNFFIAQIRASHWRISDLTPIFALIAAAIRLLRADLVRNRSRLSAPCGSWRYRGAVEILVAAVAAGGRCRYPAIKEYHQVRLRTIITSGFGEAIPRPGASCTSTKLIPRFCDGGPPCDARIRRASLVHRMYRRDVPQTQRRHELSYERSLWPAL